MDNKMPTLTDEESKEPTTDLTVHDMGRIQKFLEEGMPGIATLTEDQLQRTLELYLSGKTYHQISRIMRLERPLILYLSHKFNWFPLRREHLAEMESNIRGRVIEARITSQNFLLELTSAWEKKIGNQVKKYLSTGDSSHIEDIDPKEVDKYLKTMEMLLKMSDAKPPKTGDSEKAPTVGLNLGDGVTVKKVGDNEVEITPKATKSLLSQMADFRREQERLKNSQNGSGAPKDSDISKGSTQGENNEK